MSDAEPDSSPPLPPNPTNADVEREAPTHDVRRLSIFGFHTMLSLAVALALWTRSFPGVDALGFFLVAGTLLVLVCIWAICALVLTVQVMRRRTTHLRKRFGWLVVAPVVGALTIATLRFDVPLRTRFALSKGDFDRAILGIREDPESASSVDGRIGSYSITVVRSIPGGWLFYEEHGAFFNDAGFAYLPNGPSEYHDAGFESPEYRHLTGPWYSFVSSW